MIYTKAHTAAPSAPFCSSSLVRQTSCCRNSRYCTLRGRGTGQSSYRDTDIPMSLNHRSFHAGRSADESKRLSDKGVAKLLVKELSLFSSPR